VLAHANDSRAPVYNLAVGLRPFVETLPTSGKAGTTVIILGNNLTSATNVTFNGSAAAFTVVTSTEIKTTVPSGASTGKVKVTTPQRDVDQQRELPGELIISTLLTHKRPGWTLG
jgi:hypothetical protein